MRPRVNQGGAGRVLQPSWRREVSSTSGGRRSQRLRFPRCLPDSRSQMRRAFPSRTSTPEAQTGAWCRPFAARLSRSSSEARGDPRAMPHMQARGAEFVGDDVASSSRLCSITRPANSTAYREDFVPCSPESTRQRMLVDRRFHARAERAHSSVAPAQTIGLVCRGTFREYQPKQFESNVPPGATRVDLDRKRISTPMGDFVIRQG